MLLSLWVAALTWLLSRWEIALRRVIASIAPRARPDLRGP